MAESVTIEPKIITDGACPTKFLIVDPNPSYANVRQEDLNIYVKLVAKTKSKSIITSNNETNTVDTLDLRSIDLLTPQKKVKFQSKEGSGEIGKSVNREFLSTDWTEIGRGILTDPKLGTDYEGFGITGVDIKIEASLTPRVNIDFVDIRGATLFEQGSCSPYALFFHLPYPIFELTVKGFYGKPVKWYLNLIKFNTKFNSETGNFESKAEFIGYSYAFLADMLMGYIMAGPYMKDYDANEKLKDIYKNIGKYFGGFKDLDACPKEGCITIVSLLEKLQSLGGALGEIKAASEYEKLQNLIKIKDKLRELLELSQKYLREQGDTEKLEKKPSDNKGSGNIKLISDKKIQENSELGKLNKTYWESTPNNLGLIPLKAQYIKNMAYDGENKAGSIVKVFTTDVNGSKPLNELKFQQGFLTPQSYVKIRATSGDPWFIDLGIFNQGIISDLENIRKEVEDLRKIINEAVDIVVIEALGFKPTIRNVFIILTANVELFIKILMDVTRRAEVYHNERNYETGANYFTGGGPEKLSSGVQKEKDDKTVWPWPTYYVEEEGATVEKFPGTNDNFLGWEEVKFVEQFLTALLDMNKDIEEFGDERAGIAGRDNYVPINPLESPINDDQIELKYKEAGENSINDIYKTIGERMFVSLDHSYYNPIHIQENGVMSSSGPIRKGENWNPLFGNKKKQLVNALGKLDAQNLLNTLEDNTNIQGINNNLEQKQGNDNPLLKIIEEQLKIKLVDNSTIRTDDFVYSGGNPKTLTSTNASDFASGTFLDMPWNNVNLLDKTYIGLPTAGDDNPTIIKKEFDLTDVVPKGAGKQWKYETDGIVLNGKRTPGIIIKPNPLEMDPKDLFKIIELSEAKSAPKIGIDGSDKRIKIIKDNIIDFNKKFNDSVTGPTLGIALEESDGLVNYKVDDDTQCLTFDFDTLFIRLRPDLTQNQGLSILSNIHFLTPNYWGNDDNNSDGVGTDYETVQIKEGTSSFFLMAAAFEWGPIKSKGKMGVSNFKNDQNEFNDYNIIQTSASTTFEKMFSGTEGGHTNASIGTDTPFVYNTLVQTPLWLDNCNNFRAGINSSTLGYAGYGGDKDGSIDLFGQHTEPGVNKLLSMVCKATAKCTSKQVQDRNLAYLFLHSFKPTPFSVNSISNFGHGLTDEGGSSCDDGRGCTNVNALEEEDQDDVWVSIPQAFARIPFATAASMIKVPKLWVYAVGATFWRYRSWRGSTNNGEKWNNSSPGSDAPSTYTTGFDPLSQPGYPTRDNFYQTNSNGTAKITNIASTNNVTSILGDNTTYGPLYLGFDADIYGGNNKAVGMSLFDNADSNIRTTAYYKYTVPNLDYTTNNVSGSYKVNNHIQSSSFMDTIHQGLYNGQQTYSAGFGAYFDYYGLYSKTTQDNNQFTNLFVSRTNPNDLVFSKKAENIYALYEDPDKPAINNSNLPWSLKQLYSTKLNINGIPTTTDFRFSSVGSDIYGSDGSTPMLNSGRVMRDTWWDIKYIAPWDFGYFTPDGLDDDSWFGDLTDAKGDYNGIYATLPQVGSSMTYQSMSPAQPHYYYMANNAHSDGGQNYNDIKVIDSPYHNGNEGRIIYESLPDVVKNMFIEKFEDWVDSDFANNILPKIDPCNFGSGTESFIGNYTLTRLEDVKVGGSNTFQLMSSDFYVTHPRIDTDYVLTLSEDLNLVDGLLNEHFLILNSTPKIWWGHAEKSFPNDYFLADEHLVDAYTKAFSEEFRKQTKERINELEKDNESEEVLGESATDDDDLKLSIYRSMKSISDKWLSVGTDGKLFFNITDDDCGRIKEDDDKEASRPLAAHFSFVNRLMGDIGDEAVIDITKLNKLQDNKRESFYQLIVDLLAENKFDFFPLPSFFNFTKSGQLFENDSISDAERKKKEADHQKRLEEDLKDMFRPITVWDCVSGGPQFISMFVGGTSRALDLPPSANCPIDYKDLDSLKNDSFGLSKIGEKCPDKGGGGVSAFRVAYGIENQSHFKSIQLDQAEFSETNESLQVIDKLANAGDPSNRALKGQNLHNVYLTRSYNCTVEAMGNMMISPLMYFELTNVPMFHGTYIIKEVSHKVSPHSVATTFMGTRQPIATVPIVTEVASALNIAISNAKVTEDGRTIDEIRSQGTSGDGTSSPTDTDGVRAGGNSGGGTPGTDGIIDCSKPWVADYTYNGKIPFGKYTGGALPIKNGVCQVLKNFRVVRTQRTKPADKAGSIPGSLHWEAKESLIALRKEFSDTFGFDAGLGPWGSSYRDNSSNIGLRKQNCRNQRKECKCVNNNEILPAGQGLLSNVNCCRQSRLCNPDTAQVLEAPNGNLYSKSNHGHGSAMDFGCIDGKGAGKSFYYKSSYNDAAYIVWSRAYKNVKEKGYIKGDGTLNITKIQTKWGSKGENFPLSYCNTSTIGKGQEGKKIDTDILYCWVRQEMPKFGWDAYINESWHFSYQFGPAGIDILVHDNGKEVDFVGTTKIKSVKKEFNPSRQFSNGSKLNINHTTAEPCPGDASSPCNTFLVVNSPVTQLSSTDLFSETPTNSGVNAYTAGGHIYTAPKVSGNVNGSDELIIIWPGIKAENYDLTQPKGSRNCCQSSWMKEELEKRNIPTIQNYHILYMADTNSSLSSTISSIDKIVGSDKKPSTFTKDKTSLAGFSGGGEGVLNNYDENYKLVVLMDASLTKDPTTLGNLKNMVNGYINNGVMYSVSKYNTSICGGNKNPGSCYEAYDAKIKNSGGAVEKIPVISINNVNAGLPDRPAAQFHANVPTYMINRWFS